MPNLQSLYDTATESAGDIYRSMVPTNARLLLESVFNKQGPITNKDFSPEELDVIKRQIYMKDVEAPKIAQEAGISDYIPTKGIGYGNYHLPKKVDNYNWLQSAYASATDPEYRVATSLGAYGAKPTDSGYKAYDTYRWGDDFQPALKSISDLFTHPQVRVDRPTSLINAILELSGNKSSRPVDLNFSKDEIENYLQNRR